ncbi:conjugal transfer ATPase VirC1 [Rhizobium leguminosarum]|uniref:conjugal transfer ATPase VirC1 n=1 Tax=Rhizobium leguminosarum TaxID=384 RepID=UPI001C9517CD|nr:conjugal transfer ATPase VirC1 [Rhizobium leguminosarum]MBY5827874.1 conjugal transfer ATPase VirC1 [Rhizobium leguminosarum]
MQLLACCSFKGGTGKTTALMGLCAAFAAQGRRVALFEADENRPLTRWKENGLSHDTWDPSCEVFVADEMSLLVAAYERANREGYDYALADTHGGSSELNNTIIASSNLLIIPTMLTPLDVDETLATYRYVVELLLNEKLTTPTAILCQRVPVSRLTGSQRGLTEMLSRLPLIEIPMFERDAFAAMKDRGLLHMTLRRLSNNPMMRLVERNVRTAMDDLMSLSRMVEKKLEG